jgi:hypothetical protein
MILLNDVVEVATAPHPYAFPLHTPGSSFHEVVNSLTVIMLGHSIRARDSSPNGPGSLR